MDYQSISLNVNKRKGANLIEAMDQIEAIVTDMTALICPLPWKSTTSTTLPPQVIEQNMGLQGNMATAMVLVLIVVNRYRRNPLRFPGNPGSPIFIFLRFHHHFRTGLHLQLHGHLSACCWAWVC